LPNFPLQNFDLDFLGPAEKKPRIFITASRKIKKRNWLWVGGISSSVTGSANPTTNRPQHSLGQST